MKSSKLLIGMRRQIFAACASFACGLILLAAGAYSRVGDIWGPTVYGFPAPVLIGPLALVCLGVVLRRRFPRACLTVGTIGFVADVFAGTSLGTILIYTDNVYAACVYGPRKLAKGVLVVGGLATLAFGGVTYALWGQLSGSVVLTVIISMVLVAPILTAMAVRQHRDLAAAERARAEQVARVAELDRTSAVLAERTRMARELHDVVASHFSVIALRSTAVLSRPDLDAAAVREAMTVIRENGVQGLTEMRAMIDLLRADGEPLPATPPRLSEVDALVERIGRPVRLDVSGDVATLPPAVDLAAYRIVQESLTNAAKHGGAGAVDVAIDRRDDEIELTVDSPLGDDRPSELPGAGAGLTGMRERATMLGGGFWAGATETGWRVHVVIPTTHKETA